MLNLISLFLFPYNLKKIKLYNFIKSKFSFTLIIFTYLFSFNCVALVKPIEFTTKSKIKVILAQDKKTDLISVNMALCGAGSNTDPFNKKGLSFTTIQMLHRSKIAGLDRYQRERKLRNLGILSEIALSVSHDDLLISFKTPKENFAKALEEVNKILLFRNFDINDLNNQKLYSPANSDINKTDEVVFAKRALLKISYPLHPYGNPINGTSEDKQSFSKQDLIKYLDKSIAKDNLIISVVGDIKKQTLSKQLEKTFKNLPNKSQIKNITKPKLKTDKNLTVMYKDSPQSGAAFIQSAIDINHPDFYALVTLLDILSAKPFTSRLWIETREKRGLVYDINANLNTHFNKSPVILGFFKCNNDKANLVLDIIKNEWKKIKSSGVTKQEFEDSKTGLIGSYALNFTTPESISSYLLFLKLKGLDLDYINTRNKKIKELKITDVNNATKYLKPEELVFVIVGKPNIP